MNKSREITIRDIGEIELINYISRPSLSKELLCGIGDDAAVMKFSRDKVVVTTDSLVEDVHFKRDWYSGYDLGWKAAEINLSDIAAMGALAKFCLVAMQLPSDTEIKYVEDIYRGLRRSLSKYGVEIVGGNMSTATRVSVTLTIMGVPGPKGYIKRSGAKLGDYILVSGDLGSSAAGLRVFENKISGFNSLRKAFIKPRARMELSSVISSHVNAMMDISDGLSLDLSRLCKASKCGALIYKDKLPYVRSAKKLAQILNEDIYDYILHGGEDYELLYTVDKNNIDKVEGIIIGEIIKGNDIKIKDSRTLKKLETKAFMHF